MIRIELDPEEARLLSEALTLYLTDFRRRVAGTENPDYRHSLERTQVALERLLETLRRQG